MYVLSSDLLKAGIVRVANLCSVRTRTVLTRDNRLRLRYVASGCAGLLLVTSLYAGGIINPEQAEQDQGAVLAAMEPAAGLEAGHLFALAGKAVQESHDVLRSSHRDVEGHIRRNPDAIQTAALINQDFDQEKNLASGRAAIKGPRQLRLQVGKGDTLAGVLQEAGVSYDEAAHVVNAVAKHVNPRNIKAGQALDLSLEPDDQGASLQFAKASFVIDPLRTLYIERNGGDIKSRLDEKEVKNVREARRVVIDGSLYGSADRAGLPDNVTANAIRLFSYAVDFQRDVREGDSLDVLYDTYETDDGYVAKTGDIIYARMMLGGKELTLYRYQGKDGGMDYYTPEGKSIRKSTGLMKTPIAFGRLTSGFGVRRHPVLGYTKMHKGIDFGAPVGTPIYAAADGVIEKAGRFSTYGNYVRIKHTAKMSTAYAHMSRYGQGIRPGVRVKQGQIVGYVGTTGRSTGPHLHYEILVNGVQVNPKSVKVAVDDSLKGDELKRFRDHIRRLGQEYAERSGERVKVAAR